MTLQIEDVKRVTKEILAEYGEDYVYETDPNSIGCMYAPQDGYNDGCLIGQIVKRLDPEAFDRLVLTDEAQPADGIHAWFGPAFWFLAVAERNEQLGTGIIEATPGLALAMREAQSRQDGGATWGQAAKSILDYEPESTA